MHASENVVIIVIEASGQWQQNNTYSTSGVRFPPLAEIGNQDFLQVLSIFREGILELEYPNMNKLATTDNYVHVHCTYPAL